MVPKTRTEWWLNKIKSNKANDVKAIKALKKEGWKVINVWECDLKNKKVNKTLAVLTKKIPVTIVDPKVSNYEKHPFFVKKANEAKALLKVVGLPKKSK